MGNTTVHGERIEQRVYPPRRTLSPDVAEALKQALDESQLTYREAARHIGIAPSYLHALTRGTRCPRRPIAEALIAVLPLEEDDADDLLREAIEMDEPRSSALLG